MSLLVRCSVLWLLLSTSILGKCGDCEVPGRECFCRGDTKKCILARRKAEIDSRKELVELGLHLETESQGSGGSLGEGVSARRLLHQ